jgi:hypothetical protein
MPIPSEKLAQSLEILKKIQDQGRVAIIANEITRTHRERLLKNGFLKEVMKGWYIASRPDEAAGDSTAWYASYWGFCVTYLNKRFGDEWSLSPEQSLSLYAGNWTVPAQLLVRAQKGSNKITEFLHNTSLLDLRAQLPVKEQAEKFEGLHVFSLASALVNCSPRFFEQNKIDLQTALSMVRDSSDLLRLLLEGGHTKIAGRLAGALRDIGREKIADEIINAMKAADYDSREIDPFENQQVTLFSSREYSPYINRIRVMWNEMRDVVIKHFPKKPEEKLNIEIYLKQVESNYILDAYHSLSIEGYQVSPELIEQVRNRRWNPDNDSNDHEHKNALAARGYWQAFQAVEKSLKKVLKGANPGEVFEKDHADWYRELFAPSVAAGILKPVNLAGFRNGPVYIRGSMHVPPNYQAVREMMPAFYDMLKEESEPSVRIVLGHFFFVFIHPYFDGNGRMGRFLMNLMLASAGYPWVSIPVDERKHYMECLEAASVKQDILPFTKFIRRLLK